MVGRVGTDLLGTFLIDALRVHGIEAHVQRDEGSSTSATVVAITAGGERSFLHLVGANGRLVPEGVSDHLLARTRILHIGGYFIMPSMDGEPAARLLLRAKAMGCRQPGYGLGCQRSLDDHPGPLSATP